MSAPNSDLTLHVLGHVYLSQARGPAQVSAKGLAILTYLTLERRPFHREHLAEMMWQSTDALRNLRVELNRLRHLGSGLIPERVPMLAVSLPTDLDEWLRAAATVGGEGVNDWLSACGGVPLSGLEDLGSTEFRGWVDSQRWRITQSIEIQLSATHARLMRSGQHEAAHLIAARAEQLGWALQPQARSTGPLSFSAGGVHATLLPALDAAREQPQVALLSGRSAQSRRDVIASLTQGEWRVIHVNCSSTPDFLLAGLLHQLQRLRGEDERLQAILESPQASGPNIVRLWTLYAQVQEPLIIAFDEITDWSLVLPHVQVAMNLPVPLLLVLCPADHLARKNLQGALWSVDQSRQHACHLPPLTASEIMDALGGPQQQWSEDRRLTYGARIAMDSEGWEPLTRVLLHEPVDLGATRPRLSLAAREVLLREIHSLPPELRVALARLAMAHTPVDAALAEALIPEQPGAVGEAERLGLLLPCDPVETVHLPQLQYRPSDDNDTFCFVNEPLRVALASTLSRRERQEVRRALERLAADRDPALALHYARQEQPQATPRDPRTRLVHGLSAPLLDSAPVMQGGERRHCRTGSGYRVTVEASGLQILRHGLYGRPVTLRLPCGQVPPGPWTLTLRVDALRSGPDLGVSSAPYALAFHVGTMQVIIGTTPTFELPPGSGAVTYYTAPPGRWITVTGEGAGGAAELRVHAMDVAVTVASLRAAGLPLIH